MSFDYYVWAWEPRWKRFHWIKYAVVYLWPHLAIFLKDILARWGFISYFMYMCQICRCLALPISYCFFDVFYVPHLFKGKIDSQSKKELVGGQCLVKGHSSMCLFDFTFSLQKCMCFIYLFVEQKAALWRDINVMVVLNGIHQPCVLLRKCCISVRTLSLDVVNMH